MVNAPVLTTLATQLPEMVPKNALAITAIFAGPPRFLPAAAIAIFWKMISAPDTDRKAANNRNR